MRYVYILILKTQKDKNLECLLMEKKINLGNSLKLVDLKRMGTLFKIIMITIIFKEMYFNMISMLISILNHELIIDEIKVEVIFEFILYSKI